MPQVSVRAFNFAAFGRPVRGARIFALGAPHITLATTDRHGHAQVAHPSQQELTLVLEKPGFISTQSATLTIPAAGLHGHQEELTIQTMPTWFFTAAQRWLRVPRVPGRRHLIATVSAHGKTLHDFPQGEPHATIHVTRDDQAIDVTPIYLGILPFVHKTDLFSARWRRGTATSADGGVLLPSLELGVYQIAARAPDRRFHTAKALLCVDSPALVNLSPPWGPRVFAT